MIANSSEKMAEKEIILTLDSGAELPENLAKMENKIQQVFSANLFNLVIDLKNIVLAPTAFLILLIRTTSQARRMGGDIKLTNVNPMVRNGMVTFTPNTYLTLETSEKFALADFGETFASDISLDNNKNLDESTSEDQKKEEKEPNLEFEKFDIVSELQSLGLNDANKIRVGSSAENLYQVCDFVLLQARKAGFNEHELAKIKVTVYEASLNAIEHSYFSNPDYWIDVYAIEKNNKFYIIIHDWGRCFEFNPNRNYDVEMAVKERRTGGFGLHIIKRSVDEIYYLADNKIGNRLVLIKKIDVENNGQ